MKEFIKFLLSVSCRNEQNFGINLDMLPMKVKK